MAYLLQAHSQDFKKGWVCLIWGKAKETKQRKTPDVLPFHFPRQPISNAILAPAPSVGLLRRSDNAI